jgi:hypothetical protein
LQSQAQQLTPIITATQEAERISLGKKLVRAPISTNKLVMTPAMWQAIGRRISSKGYPEKNTRLHPEK